MQGGRGRRVGLSEWKDSGIEKEICGSRFGRDRLCRNRHWFGSIKERLLLNGRYLGFFFASQSETTQFSEL